MANALDNLQVVYTYHEHEGNEGTTADRCYNLPVYHHHESSCYCPGPSTYVVTHFDAFGAALYEYRCNSCGASPRYYNNDYANLNGIENRCSIKRLLCEKTADVTIDKYTLGCGKDENTIESATIIY